jgi:hypothetical protein
MKKAIGIAALLLILGAVAYLNNRGSQSGPWPEAAPWAEAPCKIISSRIVAHTVSIPPISALYKGEYQLRYDANGREFSIWADAVDWNEDRGFVESSISVPPLQCPYTVRYNRADPSEAVAKIKSN